jgi:transcription-repair coupling factor (superfamily II helicase)
LNLKEKFPTISGRVTLYGVPEGSDARALADLATGLSAGVLHVARDDARLAATRQALAFFAPGLETVAVPAWDCLPYDRVSPKAELAAQRTDALHRLAAGEARPRVVLTTVSALLQRVPPRAVMARQGFRARVGAPIDQTALLDFLARSGYSRVGTVMEPGEYAVRGGLIDLFPPGAEEPLRLDLFGDTLEGLRRFDPLTQRTTGQETEIVLVPAGEFTLDPDSIQRFRAGYREEFGAVTDDDPLYAAVSEGRKQIGIEHWLPLFHDGMETLFDYLPGAAITLDHLAEEARDERLAAIADYYQARRSARASGMADAGAPYKPLPPDRLYLTEADWERQMAARAVGLFNPFARPEGEARAIDLGGRRGRDFAPERGQGRNVYDALAKHVAALREQGKRVLVTCFSAGSRDRLALVLEDHGMTGLLAVGSWPELAALPAPTAGLAVLPLEHGFETPDLAVIGEQDLLGDRLVRPRRTRRAENFIADLAALTPGDLVVHVDHGIGRYDGLQTIEVSGAPHDCLMIVYDGGDRLYLPVENIEMVSRYGSEDAGVALDRLGGASWQGRKARLKQRLKDMAEELIKIAAQRQLRQAATLAPQEGLYEEFCARFPYEETEDQARAIDDAVADLGAGRPMDRLICGDVGFGKTEVALRSAFVAVLAGKQVAVVCPTTLLCRQHFKTFRERFHGLPVRIEQLSRLVPAAKASEVKRALAAGEVDIVIGTHALLGKGIAFKDLGLLIIDEEQHFGVRHKERLKQLRADVHVLTLTATPIPRTLQLALSGVRELSLIATPPVDRLAVRTFVMPFDPVVVREALLREHYRGGQSFYVCPRIEDLPDAAAFLKEHVPEVKAVVAHGRMAPSQLEEVMTAFYENRYDVLVSTNIVESGLDIPTANTLIVHRADMFGLAQLYQLRGRIGRSKLRAYAYFTLPPRRQPTIAAEKRLRVLQALDTLGAGFSLASHDLDIRGAGNLLGEEQSGHIREVGFELYQEMLEEAVAAARGEGFAAGEEEKWSPQISLGTSVLIPEVYVADLGVRLQLYRRVARLEERAEIEAFAAELIDRFGPLPDEVKHLLEIVAIKKYCRDAGVAKIEAGPRGATLAFRENRFANPAGLVDFIQRQRGAAKLRPDHHLVYMRDWPAAEDRLQGVAWLSAELAQIAAAPLPAAAMAPAGAAKR